MQAVACPCCLACHILQKTEIFQDCDFSFQQTSGKGPQQIWKHGQYAHSPGTTVTRQWWICRLSELAWQYCFWGKQVVADCFQCYSSCCTGGLLLASIATRHDESQHVCRQHNKQQPWSLAAWYRWLLQSSWSQQLTSGIQRRPGYVASRTDQTSTLPESPSNVAAVHAVAVVLVS